MQDNKALSAIEGGFLLTNSREIYERAILYSQPGRISNTITTDALKKYSEGGLGQKYRINPMGALLAIYGLSVIDERIKQSYKNYKRFEKMISKLTFFETKDCENNRRGGWKNGYARILISNHDAFKKFYSKLHDTGLPIFKEFRDNWVPNNPIYSFRSGYLKSAFQIFDSIIVFNGICSYTKDNSKILTKYEEILKEIVL